MKRIPLKVKTKQILADTITPVSIFLKFRDIFPNSLLLESSDYHGNENSYSFICLKVMATFKVAKGKIAMEYPGNEKQTIEIGNGTRVQDQLFSFLNRFEPDSRNITVNGLFGYTSYDAVQYFETIKLEAEQKKDHDIPDMRYSLYKYVIAVNHFKNNLTIIENLLEGEESNISYIESLLSSRNFASYSFETVDSEISNLTNEQYKQMVSMGKKHCYRGDVFQIVLSRQFKQKFTGDEFNVYRALRSINPSPYLFYFDYGNYRIFGSSPEAQIKIKGNSAFINPIAGTFRRSGNDEEDKLMAHKLSTDLKENAEHVMLVDLARNDLSRSAKNVEVISYREIQFYSHVIHMVSTVAGQLPENTNIIDIMADTFPAGTLSGAPKFKAMELIDKYENQNRGFYGGAIGIIEFSSSLNHAIMIRSFLSKNNTLFYQAGAGIVSVSDEESELQEVNNKLGALKKAIEMAKTI